jgi:hypothetical protein
MQGRSLQGWLLHRWLLHRWLLHRQYGLDFGDHNNLIEMLLVQPMVIKRKWLSMPWVLLVANGI